MIKPEEVRINNQIAWGVKTGAIQGIHTKEVNGKRQAHFYVNGIVGDYYCVLPEEIYPIPLSEEWMLKFGFEKEEVDAPAIATWNEWWLDGFEISSRGTEGGSENQFYYGVVTREVKYVHQLQNIYFALTGEELTLKS